MGKVLVSFVAGLLVATTAFLLLVDREDHEVRAPLLAEMESRRDAPLTASTAALTGNAEESSTIEESRQSDIGETSLSTEFPDVEVLTTEELRSQVDDLAGAAMIALAALNERLKAEELAANPVVSPSPLPPEFAWLRDYPRAERFHDGFERELVDSAWASNAESELLSYVYEQTDLAQNYGSPNIRCHTTRCEVTFVARGIDHDQSTVRDEAGALIRRYNMPSDENRFLCISSSCDFEANTDGEITTIFVGLTRYEDAVCLWPDPGRLMRGRRLIAEC
jgi:hypothetical protein